MTRFSFMYAVMGMICLWLSEVKATTQTQPSQTIRSMLAQRLLIDIRFYCDKPQKYCSEPVTQLPNELRTLFQEAGLGGVILFSENLVNSEQIRNLNSSLQTAALKSVLGLPLLISIDQEGGRVARLPRRDYPAFSGNMAIGATQKTVGDKYAVAVGAAIGEQLNSLGFNINHAPNVDVNVNPDNPVINVRSFSDQPQMVSKLAASLLNAMQNKDVLGTIKHFPGHGDTVVDSHTGLPRVLHDIKRVTDIELFPFQSLIEQGLVHLLMTAHIQYPSLDSSTIINKHGHAMIKPASMSFKIITELLRNKLNYDGIVMTDALDMKSISDYFSPLEAIKQAFLAGVDIALMPMPIRNKSDIDELNSLLDKLTEHVIAGDIPLKNVERSFTRIKNIKTQLSHAPNELTDKQRSDHVNLQQELSDNSITRVKGAGKLRNKNQFTLLIMPDESKCIALTNALESLGHTNHKCLNNLEHSFSKIKQESQLAQILVWGSLQPKQSVYEMADTQDQSKILAALKNRKWTMTSRHNNLKTLFSEAKKQQKQTIFISLRTPYDIKDFAESASDVLATFSYNQYLNAQQTYQGPAYKSIAKVLMGHMQASGHLPVVINGIKE